MQPDATYFVSSRRAAGLVLTDQTEVSFADSFFPKGQRVASGCGQADAAGPHLPSARGPLTPNVARDIGYNYAVGGNRAKDVGDLKTGVVDDTETTDATDTLVFTLLMNSSIMQPPLMQPPVSPLPSVGIDFPTGPSWERGDPGRGMHTPCTPRGAR